MAKKYKVHVHTPFNLIMPEGVTEKPFRKFDIGQHTVVQEEYDHPWLQQHAEPVDVEVEEEAEDGEETVEGETAEAPTQKKRR